MQVGVNGPDGANTLIITTGIANCGLTASNQNVGGTSSTQQGSFTALIDPKLGVGQFRRALATGSLASVKYLDTQPAGQQVEMDFEVISVEADFNDESGQVELRFDVRASSAGLNNIATVASISFQVTTLAALFFP
jgi:hypothetical protein